MEKIKIKHGLMVIDPESNERNGEEIVHFCGYEEKPSKKEVNSLREELKTDKEFGLTEIYERLIILPAPPDIVEKYRKMVEKQ